MGILNRFFFQVKRIITDVIYKGVFFSAASLFGFSSWFRGQNTDPPPPDPTPFIFVLTPESTVQQPSDRTLEILRRELEVSSVVDVLPYDTLDELTDTNEDGPQESMGSHQSVEVYTVEWPGSNPPIDSLKEILHTIHSKKELLCSKQYQYGKLALLLDQVGLKLAECVPQLDAMYETATLDDLFRLFQIYIYMKRLKRV